MGNDYEQWKKRREQQREQREQERGGELPRRGAPPAPPPAHRPPATPSYDAPAPRAYQGPIPSAPPPAPRMARKKGGARGCLGCLGLLFGLLALLAVAGLIAGTFYWRGIEQRGRVNVLILGIDERPDEGPDFRSDTMILSTFNPRARQVALLAIPRDLWVTIPGVGENRINTAHFFGGPTLAKQTVAEPINFAIPVQYYVKINFNGFVSIIDALGGIQIDVPEALHDENYPTPDYGVTTVDIAAGPQRMDGATALIYARSRYSTNDFDRGRRQQEIISAVRARLFQPGTLLRLPALIGALRSAVDSDAPLREWPALAFILARSEMQRASIGPDATTEFVTDGGAQVLLPNWEAINPILADHFED